MSILNTQLQNLRVNSPGLSKNTNRGSRYGAFEVFLRGNSEAGGIVSQDLISRARSAVGQTVQVPVWDSESVSLGSSRSVTIADSENTSQLYTVTFTVATWGFTQAVAAFMNNEKGAQEDFNRKYMKYLYKVLDTVDTACLTALNTNKSQQFGDLLGYDATGDIVTAAAASGDEIVGDLTAIMNSNDFYDNIKIVGNTGLLSQVSKMMEYGNFNSQDKTLQFLDKEFFFTNRLANEAGSKATGYAIDGSNVGIITRNEREALLGTVSRTGHEWSIEREEMLGLPIDTYYYESVGNYNAIGGAATADMTRALKRHYGFALEYATIVAYNDDLANNASPIIKFDITTA